MTTRLVTLPMYDFAELQMAHDALWNALSDALIERGIPDVPSQLTRDLPHQDVWRHPSLLFSQACEYPIATSFGDVLTLVATPCYSAPGCEGALYRSAIIVRTNDPADTLAELRGRRCIVNEPDSNSGMNLLRAAIAPLADGNSFFGSLQLSGSHRNSVEYIAQGEADVAAIDCVTFAYLQRLYPGLTEQVRIIDWTPSSPGLPFVTSHHTDEHTLETLRLTLAAVISDPSLRSTCNQLLLEGIDIRPDASLTKLHQLERDAIASGYSALR